ncbi:hypothetical protein [Streptosporangium vulgare]|uniref:hypothetical protein n=1 Tax=Streptosporangium vulgare TaxID=46190 RepID=UPI0031DB7F93
MGENRRLFAAVYEGRVPEPARPHPRPRTGARRGPPRSSRPPWTASERVWLVTGGRKHKSRDFVEDDERYLALMANRDFTLKSTDDFGYSWFGLYVRAAALILPGPPGVGDQAIRAGRRVTVSAR